MPRFNDLSDAEVLALTDEQIAYHVDFECADAGRGLLPPSPGPKPVKPEDMKDATAYKLGDFIFHSQADALAVADMVNRFARYAARYVSGPSYEMYLESDTGEVEIKPTRYYSPSGWDAAKATVLKYEAAIKAWNAATEAYNKVAKERSETAGWIHDRVQQVRDHEFERQQVVNELARYVELANGDEAMARRFLLKARPSAGEFLPPLDMDAALPTQ